MNIDLEKYSSWHIQCKINGVMKEILSVTKALVELKTLGKRIEKKVHTLQPLVISIGGKLPEGTHSKDEFFKNAKSEHQSVIDLITRKAKIKSAVIQSNAVTQVKVADETLTVAEAIERKSSIASEKNLLRKLSDQYAEHLKHVETHNHSLKGQLLKLLEATYSKSEAQISKEDHDRVATPFLTNNEAKLIDPLNLKQLCEKLEESISTFEAEVDVVLAESNARTEISI